jgi:hypothetical protein
MRDTVELEYPKDKDWNMIEEMRPQAAATLLGCSLLLVPLAFWLARRMATDRSRQAWENAMPFAAAIVADFAAGASVAGQANNAMTAATVAGALVSLICAGVALPLRKPVWLWVLASVHAVAMGGLHLLFSSSAEPVGPGYAAAALVPMAVLGIRSKWEAGEQVMAWMGWLTWTGALIGCCVTLYGHNIYGALSSTFEPVGPRFLWVAFCAVLGAVGAGALTPPGAKGHWHRAMAVQALMLAAFVIALSYNVRQDKAVAELIPWEREHLQSIQQNLPTPPKIGEE